MINWTKPIETTYGLSAYVLANNMEAGWICIVVKEGLRADEVFLVDSEGVRCDFRSLSDTPENPFIRNVKVKREGWVNITPPAVKETEAELREMMRDPRYWQKREPEWVKRVTEGFRALVGGDTPPTVQETEADWRARLLAAGPGLFLEEHNRKTLRDEFAMAALTGLLANFVDDGSMGAEDWASDAYLFADKMMEARKK
jgi:hypothetical protein